MKIRRKSSASCSRRSPAQPPGRRAAPRRRRRALWERIGAPRGATAAFAAARWLTGWRAPQGLPEIRRFEGKHYSSKRDAFTDIASQVRPAAGPSLSALRGECQARLLTTNTSCLNFA
jgi:hypothetical protein